MKAIDTETGEVVAEDLTSREIDALVNAGADYEAEEADDGGQSGQAGADETPDSIVEEDAEELQKPDLEAVDHYDEGEVDDDMAAEHLEWELDEDQEVELSDLDGFGEQYEQVQREKDEADTDLQADKDQRAERIEDGPVSPRDDYRQEVGHKTVRDYLNETGQAEQVVEAFRQFKTDDRWVQEKDGEMLNTDAVVDMLAGDTGAQDRLYMKKQKAEPGDRVVCASMDMSGSMRGVVKNAKAAMGALAIACREIGDDFVANTWTSTARSGKKNIRTQLVTGPDEDFDWEHLDSVWPQSHDPIVPGMRHIKAYGEQVSASEQVMVVISDGQPTVCTDGVNNPNRAVQEAKEEVRKYRSEGWVVIGLGIEPGADHRLMEKMFGEGGFVCSDETELADALIGIYESQMNVGGK